MLRFTISILFAQLFCTALSAQNIKIGLKQGVVFYTPFFETNQKRLSEYRDLGITGGILLKGEGNDHDISTVVALNFTVQNFNNSKLEKALEEETGYESYLYSSPFNMVDVLIGFDYDPTVYDLVYFNTGLGAGGSLITSPNIFGTGSEYFPGQVELAFTVSGKLGLGVDLTENLDIESALQGFLYIPSSPILGNSNERWDYAGFEPVFFNLAWTTSIIWRL